MGIVEGEALSPRQSRRQRDLLTVERAADAAVLLAKLGHVFTKAWLCEQFGLEWPAPADGAARDKWHTRYLELSVLWREEMGTRRKIPTRSAGAAQGNGYKVVGGAAGYRGYVQDAYLSVQKGVRTGIHRAEDWIDANELLPYERQERFDQVGGLRNLQHVLKQARPKPPAIPVPPVRALPLPLEPTAAQAEPPAE